MSSIHPVLEASPITSPNEAAPHTHSRLAKRNTVDPRGRLTCANLAAQFLVSPGSTPTLLHAISANPERSAQCLLAWCRGAAGQLCA